MSDDIIIRIKTLLEKATDAELKKVEQDIQQRVNPKIKPTLDTKNLDKTIPPLEIKANMNPADIKKIDTVVDNMGNKLTKATTINPSIGQNIKIFERFNKETEKMEVVGAKYSDIQKTNAQYLDEFNNKNINAIDYQIKQREIEARQFSKALQAKMLQETQEKKITAEIQKQSLAQQDLLNRIRGMRGIDGKYITGDNLNALNQLETQITGFDPTNKNFSKNMDEANSKLKQISTTTSIYKKEIQDANKYTGLFGQSIFEAGNFLPHYTVMYNCKCGEPRNLGCIFNV